MKHKKLVGNFFNFVESSFVFFSLVLQKQVHLLVFQLFIPIVYSQNFKILTVYFSLCCSSLIFFSVLVNSLPLIKADCLKFLIHVRNQLDRDALVQSLPECARYLSSTNIVVQTYAAHAIERLLLVRHPADPKHTA